MTAPPFSAPLDAGLPETTAPALAVPCDVCPHPSGTHDRIGQRFCDATLTGAISRGCICRAP